MSQNSSGRPGAKRHDKAKKIMGKSPDHKARQREHDAKRWLARERGYNTRREKARKTYLMRNPLCVMCATENQVTAATVVDHIISHKGNAALFWGTENNWQSLCKPHRDRDKQRDEQGRFQAEGEDGWPVGGT